MSQKPNNIERPVDRAAYTVYPFLLALALFLVGLSYAIFRYPEKMEVGRAVSLLPLSGAAVIALKPLIFFLSEMRRSRAAAGGTMVEAVVTDVRAFYLGGSHYWSATIAATAMVEGREHVFRDRMLEASWVYLQGRRRFVEDPDTGVLLHGHKQLIRVGDTIMVKYLPRDPEVFCFLFPVREH